MYILGIWDGHDAGAALIDGNNIIFAANEERFTKRKLEIKFPANAINAALRYGKITHSDIEHIVFTTTEFAKTLQRAFPTIKENYYQLRRRKVPRPALENFRPIIKYTLPTWGMLPFCDEISRNLVRKQLERLGFRNFKLHIVEHHTAHAATAAFTSGFRSALVITIDGLGDGLSGSISVLENGRLERKETVHARDSIGVFFEQVTNIAGMRELEDEGKVMAMACYSYPFPFEENKLKDFFTVTGTEIKAKYGPVNQYYMLQKLAWAIPREQFAYMAQQVLENVLTKFVDNAVNKYNIHDVALAGGIFANVKANMMIRNLESVKHWYIFPHMGDGGIALGAALYANYMMNGIFEYRFGPYLGYEFNAEYTEEMVKRDPDLEYKVETPMENAAHAAELISKGNYLFWFQGRMEYGPRALGNRSILAQSDSEEVKERLNLYVKKREWYQPFAPSILETEAKRILEFDDKGYDKMMTMGYMLKPDYRYLKSVSHIDGSVRPQMVGEENKVYMELLKKVRRHTGDGIVLNTSFNIHGLPIVMNPEDAIHTLKATKTKYMFINGIFVTNKSGV